MSVYPCANGERVMGEGKEALVVCSDRSMGIGITVWDLETGERILHIPTCASPAHGLVCLRNQFLVASQINRHGSVGGGSVFTWSLNKPHPPLQSYPMEAIGPLSCTRDGMYLVGGASSGNAYIWEVTSGRLLKTWHAHSKALKCIVFSGDGSFLISGSGDGRICAWSIIGLLDMEDSGNFPSLLHYSSEHQSSITDLLTISGSTKSVFISSSLDRTCKAWDLVSGRLIQSLSYPQAITSILLHPVEQLLFTGSVDGRIFVNSLNIGLVEDDFVVADEQAAVLKGHNGSITAMTFCGVGLLSASEDCTVCLWDITSWVIIRRFNHPKGAVTNLIVIPQHSLVSASSRKRNSNQFRVSLLDKCPQSASPCQELVTFLPSCSSLEDDQIPNFFQRANTLDRQIFDLEHEQTPAAMQMKVETTMDNRMWATRMTKHVMEMNKHLQSRLLDMMQCRLYWPTEMDSSAINSSKKKKKLQVESPPLIGEELAKPPC
ncbi:protein ROOT INITIATION DEFECTIVE 3-like [Tripterygium wilfordii]|uniref:protein ROOT INITIATION DEFECTIVE 3-like n=1 Tax=Tripterygium wilfordii TaxID=458696 RepID=UPI0018F86295|nr:protein ROOT INITIATION DEFECTIVE 3-like [Tripterygium wilfordii]